jgi:hypothetical protein
MRSDALEDAGNLSTVLAHQINNSVQSIDLVLIEIRDHEETSAARAPNNFDRMLGDKDTNRFLLERLSHLLQAIARLPDAVFLLAR